MVINVKRLDTFIPEFDGNKDKPEDEQIKIYHRFLSNEERGRFVYTRYYTQGQAEKLYMTMESMTETGFDIDKYAEANNREFVQDGKGIAKAIVTKIENLTLEYEGGAQETIDTIDKFYEAPDAYPALRIELEDYMIRLSARADTKN